MDYVDNRDAQDAARDWYIQQEEGKDCLRTRCLQPKVCARQDRCVRRVPHAPGFEKAT
jgi:hypothetical protein